MPWTKKMREKQRQIAKDRPKKGSEFIPIEDVCISNCCDAKIETDSKHTKWHKCTKCGNWCNWRDGRI